MLGKTFAQVQDPSPIYDLRRARHTGSSTRGTMGGRVARCLLQDRAVRLPASIIRKRSREHACRRVEKILMSWDPAMIVYETSLRISSPFFLDNARDRLPSDHLDGTIYVCGNIFKYSYMCMCDTEIKQ